MKMKKCVGLVLVLALVIGSLGVSATATESSAAIERASGHFSETISAGKYKKIGGGISMASGEIINFNAVYSPRSASVDFGLIDSNNVFTYINVTNGSVDAGVAAPGNGTFTPAIRNNSSDSVYVTGIIEC